MTQDSKPSFPNLNYVPLSEETIDEMISKNNTGIPAIDAANKLEKEIYNDHLTDFENRKGLNRYKNNLKPDQYPVTMISIDLDNLKQINDNPDPNNGGHAAGDRYILSFVKFINIFFPDNKKFRLGGDEFLIPVSHLDPEKLASLYQKLEIFNEEEKNPNLLKFTFGTAIAHSDKDFYSALKDSDDKLVISKSIKKRHQA